MSTQDDKPTNEPEVKEVQEAEETAKETPQGEEPKAEDSKGEQTLGEVFKQEEPTPKKEGKPDSIPFNVFETTRNENRELKRRLKELETSIDDGATKKEVDDEIKSLAKEYEVDERFLSKLKDAIQTKFENELDEKITDKLKPLEERERKEQQEKVFNRFYKQAIEKMPEYKGIANKEVIKVLAMQASNQNKTLSQLIEDTYGNALGGKRTIETTTPRGGADPSKVDIERATKDPVYFKEVMADPELKKQYNDNLAQRALR